MVRGTGNGAPSASPGVVARTEHPERVDLRGMVGFLRRHSRLLLHILVFVGLGAAGIKLVNGGEFWQAVHRFNWAYAPGVLALAALSTMVKATRFATQLRALVRVPYWPVFRAYVAGQACALLPAGATFRIAFLSRLEVPESASAASVALSSLTDQVVLLTCALTSALWFGRARGPAEVILGALVIGSVLLGLEASRTWLLERVERLMAKVGLAEFWRAFLSSLGQLSSLAVVGAGLVNAALAAALLLWALHLCVIGVGAEVTPGALLLAYTLPAALGRISAMPGGVGVTEAGMIGILNAAPGVTIEQAAAATALFRVGTVLFTALVGGLLYLATCRAEGARA
jgi:uncharacterized membrane protein YbhN (UPF0104 family)